MPSFYLFHIVREASSMEHPLGGIVPALAVSFLKVKDPATKLPITITSDSPENALGHAKRRFPYLVHSLAVQEVSEYDNAANAGRVLRPAKAHRARLEG